MKRLSRWIWIAIGLLLLSGAVLAQDDTMTYTDGAGRFTIPIPEGWTDESTDDLAHFIDPDGAVSLYALVVETDDTQAGITAALGELFDGFESDPLQSTEAPLPNGLTWIQNIYQVDGELIAALGYAQDGVVYTLVARGEQAALTKINSIILEVLLGYTPLDTVVIGYTPPSYTDESTFTEQEIVVESGQWSLPGTLTLPQGDGPFPAVVLVHGSGSSDRNEQIGINRPFQDIAWGLASNGIAVLRYDKRGFVYGADSFSDPYEWTVQDEVINDALAALALLHNTEKIDPSRIFVLGHSLGGMMAPRIARDAGNLAGIVMLAGNARPFDEVALEQFAFLATLPENMSDEGAAVLSKVQEDIKVAQSLNESSDREQILFGLSVAYWLDLQTYNQVDVAQSLDIAMLFLQGEVDYQVTMEDFGLWQEALADHDNTTFKSYPGLYHLFMPGEGIPADYAVAANVSADVVGDIVEWVLESRS